MRSVWRFLKWAAFAIIVLPIADKHLFGQQGPRPAMKSFFTSTNIPYDTSLPWFSEYHQPPIYREWWREIAECEGFEPLPDSVTSRIQFFQVNASSFRFDDRDGDDVLAVTFQAVGQIYMGSPYIWKENQIKHEMLHVVLWKYGFRLGNFHPVEFFEACGLHRAGIQ